MVEIKGKHPNIVVVGSSSIDFVLETPIIPKANDTVLATESRSVLGGKGANQAIGTARLGAHVYLVSCVGMDPYGQQVTRNLADEGVNVAFVRETDEPTGTAYVTTSKEGNAIVVIPAANYCLSPKYIDDAERYISTADLVLTQLEIPMESFNHLVKKCKKLDKKLGIYAAPAKKLSQEAIEFATFIVAKSQDLNIIFGEENVEDILRHYPNKLFLRDDANSTSFFNGVEMKYFRKNPDSMSNKMGMGDAFTSGFSVAYLHQNSIEDCVKFGNKVAFKVAEQLDSQTGLPKLKDL